MNNHRKEIYGKVKQAIVEAHEAGLTYDQVAQKLGMRKPSLYTAAKRIGLTLKKYKNRK